MAKKQKMLDARELRIAGKSVVEIARILEVAKSSVFTWTKDIARPYQFTSEARAQRKLERRERLKQARQKSGGRPRKERMINGGGRWVIHTPDGYFGTTLNNGRYVYEHRYLMEQHIGRLLNPDEVIHHKNGDKLDNSIDNLELLNYRVHISQHSAEKGRTMLLLSCPNCRKQFDRPRNKVIFNKSKLCFCSSSCSSKFYHRLPTQEMVAAAQKSNIIKTYVAYP